MTKQLIIKGTIKEVNDILERISEQYPNMTIQEYLDKYQETLILC